LDGSLLLSITNVVLSFQPKGSLNIDEAHFCTTPLL